MCEMGLFLIGCNSDDAFLAANANTYNLFDDKIARISEFVFDIYDIQKPWERKALHSYLLDKMEQKTFFFTIDDNKSAIFSELFEKECFEVQASYFLSSYYPCFEREVIIVGFKLCFDKLYVFIISDNFEKAFFTISNINDTYMLEYCNVEILQKILKIDEEFLDALCKEKNFSDITKKLSLLSGLRFDLTYKDVYKQRRKLKATEMNTLS